MLIAAVVNDKNKIVPIIAGEILRIYDTESRIYKDFENPALHLKERRRGAVLTFVEEKGATVFVSPPETFCELSYEKAKKDGIKFYHLEKAIPYEVFLNKFHANQLETQTELPEKEIVPSF